MEVVECHSKFLIAKAFVMKHCLIPSQRLETLYFAVCLASELMLSITSLKVCLFSSVRLLID